MRVEYLNKIVLNKIIGNKKEYDGMYYPSEKVIQVDLKINAVLKFLTILHELTHWVLDKVIDNSDIYVKFSDIVDKIQSKLPW